MKRNKRIFCICVMLLIAIISNQDAYAQQRNFFGVRASYERSNNTKIAPVGTYNYKKQILHNGNGYDIGLIYHVGFKGNWFIEPGLYAFYIGGTIDKESIYKSLPPILAVADPNIPVKGHNNLTKNNYYQMGLRIPVNIGFGLQICKNVYLSAYTGPEINIGLRSKIKIHNEYQLIKVESNEIILSEPQNYDIDAFKGRYFKRFDLAWGYGLGLDLMRHYHIGVGLSHGLIDTAGKNLGSRFHQNRLVVSIGYNF